MAALKSLGIALGLTAGLLLAGICSHRILQEPPEPAPWRRLEERLEALGDRCESIARGLASLHARSGRLEALEEGVRALAEGLTRDRRTTEMAPRDASPSFDTEALLARLDALDERIETLAQAGRNAAVPWELQAGRVALFSPDGRQLLTAASDTTVRIWDASTGEVIEPPEYGPISEPSPGE